MSTKKLLAGMIASGLTMAMMCASVAFATDAFYLVPAYDAKPPTGLTIDNLPATSADTDADEDKSAMPLVAVGLGGSGAGASGTALVASGDSQGQFALSLSGQDAQSGSCGSNLTWSLTGTSLVISGTGAMTDYSTESGPGWQAHCADIKSITIGNGVTSIGNSAFADCSSLETLTVGSGVKSIGAGAFYNCSALASVSLPASVQTLGRGAFAGCTAIRSFSAPGLKTIDGYALQGTQIATFTVPKTLTDIAPGAFFESKIGQFAVESGNTAYTAKNGILYSDKGKTLFAYPAGRAAESFSIPWGVTTIGEQAFLGSNITGVNIPSTVTTLGSSAFQECLSLKAVTIPDSVTKADYFTFYGCTALESVKFGKNLKSTSYEMFMGCYALKAIAFGGLTTLDAQTFANCLSLESVVVPATVTTIESGAFGCDPYTSPKLKSVTILGASVIPFQAFLNQTQLTSVTFGNAVNHISRGAFQGCSSLSSVVLPSSVTFCHHWAFPETTAISCKNPRLGLYAGHGYQQQETIGVKCTTNYSESFKVLTLVNQERAKAGLSALRMDASLLSAATVRAAETAVLFSHTRPDSSTCFTADSKMVAENIAYGQNSASAVMSTWMNSSGHRANILSSTATTIGIGCVKLNGTLYWVQCFGSNKLSANCAKPSDRTFVQQVNVAARKFEEAATSPAGVEWSFEDKEYTIGFNVELSKSTIAAGKTTTAKLSVWNSESSGSVPVENVQSGSWSSSSRAAKVSSRGATATVTGVEKGSAKITWTGRFLKASATAKVTFEGGSFTVAGYKYQTTSPTTVQLVQAPNKKALKVPATVKSAGKKYKVTAIANYAFKTCSKAKKITIGNNVTTLGAKTFSGASNVSTLVIGSRVSKIGKKTFAPLKKLTRLTVKTRKLTKSSVKGSLKRSKVKTITVKIGSKKTSKKYAAKYSSYFTAKNAGKKVKVKA